MSRRMPSLWTIATLMFSDDLKQSHPDEVALRADLGIWFGIRWYFSGGDLESKLTRSSRTPLIKPFMVGHAMPNSRHKERTMKAKYIAAIVIVIAAIFLGLLEVQEFLHLSFWSR
jgi:hypothetical protein